MLKSMLLALSLLAASCGARPAIIVCPITDLAGPPALDPNSPTMSDAEMLAYAAWIEEVVAFHAAVIACPAIKPM